MSDLLHLSVRESRSAELRGTLERIPLLSRLRKELASNRPTWLPLVLVLAAIAVVAYADHLVVSLSLVYLYTLPLTVGAIFLRKEISYGLIVACILFHYFFHYFDFPRHIHLGLRIFHDLSALLCLTLVVYVIQRYIERQESLVKAVQQQRDEPPQGRRTGRAGPAPVSPLGQTSDCGTRDSRHDAPRAGRRWRLLRLFPHRRAHQSDHHC